jgi:drug/metabolite transporter (DMT)-like permease
MVSIIFGLSFLFTKQALDSVAPMVLLALRFAVAAVLLSLLALTGVIKLDYKGKPLGKLFLLVFLHPLVYFIFETIGVKLTSSSEAGIMIALIPILVTILGAIFLKERPGRIQGLFISGSVIGALFIIFMSESITVQGHPLGIVTLMGAVLAGSAFNILSRKLSESFTSVEITFCMIWTGTIFFNLVSIIQGVIGRNLYEQYIAPIKSSGAIISILYLGVVASVIAFFMFNYTLAKLPAANAAVFSNLTTVISIIAGVYVRHESFHSYQIIGGILIILGVWGTNYFTGEPEEKVTNI